MDKLPPDLLIKIALDLDYPELIALCRTSSILNNKICNNMIFWRNKFVRDFPNERIPYNPKLFYKNLFIVNNKNIFEQLFAWVRFKVKLTNLDDNIVALKNNLKYELELSDDRHNLTAAFEDGEEYWPDHWKGHQFIRHIPEDISLDSYVYLPNNICLINTEGINDDDRGTENAELEFGDFHPRWRLNKGLYKVYDLANAFYKIKSHKFDNWYEMVQSIHTYRFNKRNDCIVISFSVDHGS